MPPCIGCNIASKTLLAERGKLPLNFNCPTLPDCRFLSNSFATRNGASSLCCTLMYVLHLLFKWAVIMSVQYQNYGAVVPLKSNQHLNYNALMPLIATVYLN